MDPEFCLVIEFMDRGTLFDCVQQNNLTWKMKADMCTDVARGMMYLHTRNPPIIHRDVKSLNILVRDFYCFYSLYKALTTNDRYPKIGDVPLRTSD